jgi:hypothetical protein
VTTADYRSVVVATKTSGGGAPTAAVTVDTFGRAVGGHWQRVGARRLAGPFFWKTVTAPHALCRLEIVTASSPRVTVQLLRTPSLGCARAETIPIPAR